MTTITARCLARMIWIDLHGRPVERQREDDPLTWPRFYRCPACARTEYHPVKAYLGVPRCGAGRTPEELGVPSLEPA